MQLPLFCNFASIQITQTSFKTTSIPSKQSVKHYQQTVDYIGPSSSNFKVSSDLSVAHQTGHAGKALAHAHALFLLQEERVGLDGQVVLQGDFGLDQVLQGVLSLRQPLLKLLDCVLDLSHLTHESRTRTEAAYLRASKMAPPADLKFHHPQNKCKLFYSRLQYLWCGLSLQSSTLGLRVLSSSLVWATFSGHSLSLRALFRLSISISVWKISCRVWATTDTERSYRQIINCHIMVEGLIHENNRSSQ